MRFMWPHGFCKRTVCFKSYEMTQLFYKAFLGFTLLAIPVQTLAKNPQSQSRLEKIHADILTDYPSLSHISRADLQSRLNENDVLILDTRPLKEYNVSHIPGALQVDPHMDATTFQTKFGSQLKDKTLIVYCSVGRRSSILGERLQKTAIEAGALSVKNMEGGVFGWHNDGRVLENESGPTASIHPYNVFWGRLINNKSGIRYKAEK